MMNIRFYILCNPACLLSGFWLKISVQDSRYLLLINCFFLHCVVRIDWHEYKDNYKFPIKLWLKYLQLIEYIPISKFQWWLLLAAGWPSFVHCMLIHLWLFFFAICRCLSINNACTLLFICNSCTWYELIQCNHP